METTSTRKQISLIALTIALIVLALAVFNWGLQYKMSLYQTSGNVTHSPAKLWVGKTVVSAAAIASPDQQRDRLAVDIAGSVVPLLLLLRPRRTDRICRLVIPWKLQVRTALRAFSFRPPPVSA